MGTIEQKRFIFFRGLYSTLDLFTAEMAQICKERGYVYMIIDAKKDADSRKELMEFRKSPVTAAIGFGNMGMQYELEDGSSVWDTYRIPYVNVMMDHPFHFSQLFGQAAKNMIVFCPDQNHVNYIKRFFPKIKTVAFLPHGGVEIKGRKRPMKERSIEVLYAGGLSRGVVGHMIPDFTQFTDFDADLLTKSVMQELISHPHKTTEQVIEAYLCGIDVHYEEDKLQETIREFRFIDSYVTSFYREMTVKTLVENGIKVVIYGAGWDVCDWIQEPNADYRGVVPAGHIPMLMGDSKIVLNTMTWFKDGSHDRVFNGMLAGAAVVSDTSEYMNQNFTSGVELEMFELEELKSLPERIKYLLRHEEDLQQMADRGYACAAREHRWEHRLDEILQVVAETE